MNKYATRESGDTVEIVERAGGGLSALLVDGQGSGKAAKLLSQFVVTQAVTLIKQGARDGVVARAAHDYLLAYRQGQVSATLNIISVELTSQKLIISRNTHCPVLVRSGEEWQVFNQEMPPLGLYPLTRPALVELPLRAPTYLLAVTDGVSEAGRRYAQMGDLQVDFAEVLSVTPLLNATSLAEAILQRALSRDKNRPEDDMSVVVLAVTMRSDEPLLIRKMSVTLPYE